MKKRFLLVLLVLFAAHSAGFAQHKTWLLRGTTDANGNFDIDHRLDEILGGPVRDGMVSHGADATLIVGVIVSVKNSTNNSWYTIYATDDGSRIAWDDKKVSGRFPMSQPQHVALIDKSTKTAPKTPPKKTHPFANQPVRILIFTVFILG